jgi:hypothetical protein
MLLVSSLIEYESRILRQEVLTMVDVNNTSQFAGNRRQGEDRRTGQTSPFSRSSLHGSRRTIRRAEDRNTHYYVDLYARDEGLIVILILMFSIADAFLTLELVGGGMVELNYIMYYYMQLGPLPFVLMKFLMTAIGLFCLLIHKNYFVFRRRVSVKAIMIGLAVMYSLLIGYELFLYHQCCYFPTLALSMTTGFAGTS